MEQTKKIFIIIGFILGLLAIVITVVWFLTARPTKTSVISSTFTSSWFPSLPFINQKQPEPIITITPTQNQEGGDAIKPLSLIFDQAVGDFDITTLNNQTFISLTDRAKNHVYWGEMIPTNAFTLTRLTNTTQVNKSIINTWSDPINKKINILQIDPINNNNLLINITPDGSTSTTSRQILNKITQVLQLSNNLLVVSKNQNTTIGFKTNNKLDQNNSLLFRIPLTDLQTQSASSTIIIWNKPSAKINSYVYTLNSSHGELEKIITGKGIIPILSPDGENVLYSNNQWGQIYIYSINKKTTTTLQIGTLASKCAWFDAISIVCAIPKNRPVNPIVPDDWYQGKLLTDDSLRLINTQTKQNFKLADNIDSLNIDVGKIKVSTDGLFIVFQNKKDHKVWSINLTP